MNLLYTISRSSRARTVCSLLCLSRKMGEGDFRDIAHPLVSETRNKIRDAIFAEYDKVLAQKAVEDAACR